MIDQLTSQKLTLSDFFKVLNDFGYCDGSHLEIVTNVYHMMTGLIKDCHRGPNAVKPVYMGADDLRPLLFCIHNIRNSP